MLGRTPPPHLHFFTQNIRHSRYVYVSSTLAILSCISNFHPDIVSSFFSHPSPIHPTFPLGYTDLLILSKFKNKKEIIPQTQTLFQLSPFQLLSVAKLFKNLWFPFLLSYLLATNPLRIRS